MSQRNIEEPKGIISKLMNIIGINGSPKTDGLTASLLGLAIKQSQNEGALVQVFNLSEVGLPFFNGQYTKRIPEKHKDFFHVLLEADGIIFASPVHWFNMSALMKNLIDWMTILEIDDFKMEGKAAAFITTCEEDGGQQAILSLMAPLNQMGFIFPPYCGLFYNKNVADKSEHQWMNNEARLIGSNIVRLIKQTRNSKWGYEDIKSPPTETP